MDQRVRMFVVTIPALISCAVLSGLLVDLFSPLYNGSVSYSQLFANGPSDAFFEAAILFASVSGFIGSVTGICWTYKSNDLSVRKRRSLLTFSLPLLWYFGCVLLALLLAAIMMM